MREHHSRLMAADYFRLPLAMCWQWRDNYKVVEWAGGGTIAFVEEIERVLSRLAANGLPTFESVLFLMDRCRRNRPPLEVSLGRLSAVVRMLYLDVESPPALADQIDQLRADLRPLDETLQDESANFDEKLHLLELLFETLPADCLHYPPDSATEVLEALGQGLESCPIDRHFRDAMETLPLTVRTLQYIAAHFDRDSLQLANRTGLDRLVQAASLECPPFEKVRGLLKVLEKDSELHSLARLARDLMAAVHIPRPIAENQDLPVGGVSDITNRGPLDRLLLSELANDDLTLAVRVALNEALYLRRETPPRTPRGRRAILLDVGIRMWGMPRVFATATTLALAATANACGEVVVYRAAQSRLMPVDLTTREGLIKLLEALETDPHPGPALPAFLETAGGTAEPCDMILVTHRDCLADREFRGTLPGEGPSLHCASVTAEGDFQLHTYYRGGWTLVREASINLESVLQPPTSAVPGLPLALPDRSAHLPLILSVQPFPLLLPAVYRPGHGCEHPVHGLIAMTKDARLMHWTASGRGGSQLAARLPPGLLDWIHLDDNGIARLLLRHRRKGRLVTVDPSTRESGVIDLEGSLDAPLYVGESGGALVFRTHLGIWVFDLLTGRIVASKGLSSAHYSGRYVLDNQIRTITWDGVSLRFDALRPIAPALREEGVLAVFDREGFDGPFLVTRGGRLICTDPGNHRRVMQVTALQRVRGISRDGHRISAQTALGVARAGCNTPGEILLIDTKTGQVRSWTGGDERTFLDGPLSRFNQQLSLHKAWLGVLVAPGGGIQLLGRKERCSRIDIEKQICLRRMSCLKPAAFTRFRPLAPELRGEVTCPMWVAVLEDNHRVFLDSRGLLHLKSADPAVPETSLVLRDDGALAGWCSDGTVCGDTFFLPNPGLSDHDAVFANVMRFARGVR